jgi:putative transposase
MSRKRHTAEEIVAKLRQVEVLTAQGRTVAEAIRSIGVTEVSSGTSCSTERSSPRSRRPGSSSRHGAGTTTRSVRTRRSATSRPPQRSCCGRLRFPGQLRRPPRPWRSDPSSTNSQPGPPNGGQPVKSVS